MSASGTQGEGRRSSSSSSYRTPSAMTTIMDERAGGETEAEGGLEGKSGSLYSANSDPGYGPMGDPGMNGGKGAGGMKTGEEVRRGERSMGRRERLVGNCWQTSSMSTPSTVATCSNII